MVRETIHKAYRAFTYATMINFLLFGLIALSIGGDAINGKVEEGRYYLNNHGHYTEVGYIVFIYSKLHALIVITTFPLLIPASITYWLTGGNEPPSSAIASIIKELPDSPILYVFYIINSFLWKASDFVEGIFWSLLDSWRTPSVEFFTRLSEKECTVRLFEALNLELSACHSKRPIIGFLSGTHFCLSKQPRSSKETGVSLWGKFSSTHQGTFVRAWYRLPAVFILIYSLSLSIPLGFFTFVILANVLIPAVLHGFQLEWPSWLLVALFLSFMTGLTLLFVWISSSIGSKRNTGLARFLQHALEKRAC